MIFGVEVDIQEIGEEKSKHDEDNGHADAGDNGWLGEQEHDHVSDGEEDQLHKYPDSLTCSSSSFEDEPEEYKDNFKASQCKQVIPFVVHCYDHNGSDDDSFEGI